jgi:hypothetical protein
MRLSFPASPTVNQQSVQNGRTFAWTGAAWELVAETAADPRWNLFLPAAPTGLTVTAGNAQASLSWTAPTGVIAQAPITDYVVQFSSNSGSTWSNFADAVSTTASVTVTGLTNGTAYVFRVAAINGVGVGAFTAASAAVTPSAPPAALFSFQQAPAGSGTPAAKWTWSAPAAWTTVATANQTVSASFEAVITFNESGDGPAYVHARVINSSGTVLQSISAEYNNSGYAVPAVATSSTRTFNTGDQLQILRDSIAEGQGRLWIP